MLWFERQEGRGKLNTFSLGHSQLRASVHSIHGGKKIPENSCFTINNYWRIFSPDLVSPNYASVLKTDISD